MTRAKKDSKTTTIVWHENLPPELDEFLKKQFEEAEERDKRRQDKRAEKRSAKKDKKA
jgi:hypothetical protein